MISKRIKTLVELIPNNTNVCDIGSDHGYLLINLKEKDHNGLLLGIENKKGPYSNLVNNIKKYDYNDIKCSLSDGLDEVSSEYNLIVLAGMGFDNIKNIVDKNINKIKDIEYFVIDSHTKNYDARTYFTSLGYLIDEEEIIYEDDIYYDLIRFKKGNVQYNKIELLFGPILIKKNSKIFKDKLKYIYNNNLRIIEKVGKVNKKYYELVEENKIIKDLLDN